MRRFLILLLCLLMCLLPVSCVAQEVEEDVSLITILEEGEDDSAGTEGGEDAAVPDSSVEGTGRKAVYGLDGSLILTLTFTGDMTIGSNAKSSGKSMFEKELDKQKGDVNFPFRNVKDILANDDLTVVNFEGTLTTGKINPEKRENDFLFSAPPEYVSMLPDNSVEAVSLENNHVMDFGADGLQDTKDALTGAGVLYASEGEPAIYEVFGEKIGMLAYQTFDGRHDEIESRLASDIADLRSQGCVIVVVSYHWGAELEYAPNSNNQALGKATIDAGADLVIGHHSHRINPIEEYNGKYIVYSLANFSFAGNNKPKDMSTFLFQIRFGVKDGAATPIGFIIIPCRISSRTDYNDMAPTPYTKDANIEDLLKVLRDNGKKLSNPVSEYPLAWAK